MPKPEAAEKAFGSSNIEHHRLFVRAMLIARVKGTCASLDDHNFANRFEVQITARRKPGGFQMDQKYRRGITHR